MGKLKRFIARLFTDEDVKEILLARQAYQQYHLHKNPVKSKGEEPRWKTQV